LVNGFLRLSENGGFGPEIARATTQNDSKFLKKTASRKKTPTLHHHICRHLKRQTGRIERVLHGYSNERFQKTVQISRVTYATNISVFQTGILLFSSGSEHLVASKHDIQFKTSM